MIKRKKKIKSTRKTSKKIYDKPISLYPLKPEEALAAFMKVNSKKVKAKHD